MKKRTEEAKNRRAIKELQKSLTATRRALRRAEKRIDRTFDLIMGWHSDAMQRIRFIEQGKVRDHEEHKRWLQENENIRETLGQERVDRTMNYRFPEWIEKDRERGFYNLG